MKFRSDKITGLLHNPGDCVGNILRQMDPNKRVVVSQGFGVPENGEFPLRFLAYIIPVLHLLLQLPKTAVVEWYFATQGIIRAQGNSPWWHTGNLCDSVLRMSNVIRNYVRQVHSDIASRVNVFHDRIVYPNSPTEILIQELLRVAEKVASEKVRAFAQKRGGKNALRYMVEHMLYMRDDNTFLGLVPDMIERSQFDFLIMVGGPAERIFYELRQNILREMGKEQEGNFQFFTPVGDPPTYHQQDGEPLWNADRLEPHVQKVLEKTHDETTPGMGVRQAVLRDILVLLNDAGGSKDFRWCGPAATSLDKDKMPDLPLEVLQCGWDVVRSIRTY